MKFILLAPFTRIFGCLLVVFGARLLWQG